MDKEYITGVTKSGTAGSNGLLVFTPTLAGTYYYYCQNHSGMGGTIIISGDSGSSE